MNKEQLRAHIAKQTERFEYYDDVTVYAAYPLPERKHPNTRFPNLREENYQKFLDDIGVNKP